MKSIHKYMVSCFLLGCLSMRVIARDMVAIKADRVDTVTAGIIENGIIVIRDSKISAIGADVEIPENAKIMDAHDKTVFPGLINPSSRIGCPRRRAAGLRRIRIIGLLTNCIPSRTLMIASCRPGSQRWGLYPGATALPARGPLCILLVKRRRKCWSPNQDS